MRTTATIGRCCCYRRPGIVPYSKSTMIALAPTASSLFSYPSILFTSTTTVGFSPPVQGFLPYQQYQQQQQQQRPPPRPQQTKQRRVVFNNNKRNGSLVPITTRFYSTRLPSGSQEEEFLSLPPVDDTMDLTSITPFSTSYHSPVMVRECIDALLDCQRARLRRQAQHPSPNHHHHHNNKNNNNNNSIISDSDGPLLFVDGTLGGGGHTAALLESLGPTDIVLGCDIDPIALQTASSRLSHFMNHPGQDKPLFIPVECNFGDLAMILPTVVHPCTQQPILEQRQQLKLKLDTNIQPNTHGCIDGILLDFGVSSYQIDEPTRGFSFMRDGPLDMRMAANSTHHKQGLTAADICNEFDAQELQRIFSKYGDEPRAKTLAQAVVKHRPLTTTGELVKAIASVTPAYAKNKRKGQTATCARIFQSLRIVVNNEDGVLEQVLSEACPTLLGKGGRLVCLSYHSMEDRATKRIMRDGRLDGSNRSWEDEKDIYGNYLGPPKPFRPIGKPIKASAEEVERNTRARSAVLRVGERL
jgi:16S rRNA (cytosine1402-N4)-methyltransferase